MMTCSKLKSLHYDTEDNQLLIAIVLIHLSIKYIKVILELGIMFGRIWKVMRVLHSLTQ